MAGERHHPVVHRHAVRRRTEDVDYWRKRSGWFDDDRAMKDYNDGVYDTYYQLDDDRSRSHRSGGITGGANSDLINTCIKVLAVVVALALCFLMFRILNRRLGSEKKEKKRRSSSTGRSGERSSSRPRSRSRSRKGEYDLMSEDTDNDGKSRGSNRSRSKSGRSRSRTRARSRSASRRESTAAPQAEAVLV
jgi:hypothetical protein